MAESIPDQMVHNTARIECWDANGQGSSGTTSFFSFCKHDGDRFIPSLVTNKHVIENAVRGELHFNICDDSGAPAYGQHIKIPISEFDMTWVPHPDPDIDLAVLPIGPMINWLKRRHGRSPYLVASNRTHLATAADLSELTAVEDILMVGYPNGLWDSRNNMPIARRGITATPPYLDFDGRPEFMIDCACFPGSSGSPIYLYNPGHYENKKGRVVLGDTRFKLIGVLHSGPMHTAEGEITIRPIANMAIARIDIPINLGCCVKAEQLLAFEEHFERLINAQQVAEKAAPEAAAAATVEAAE